MQCPKRPILCGPPHDDHEPIGTWLSWRDQVCYRKQCKLNEFSYDDRGQIVRLSSAKMGQECLANPAHPCVVNKKRFAAAGYATQPDANYFALQILARYPEVAEALVSRFPVIMIDEAQDTSRIQMAIVDALIAHGSMEVMLVGDADQAIYEWRDAEPQLFLAKCREWSTNSITLAENWRSTTQICAVLSALSSSPEKMVAVNTAVRDKGTAPEVWGYSTNGELPGLMSRFLQLCGSRGIDGGDVSVLSRSNDFLNEVKPGAAPSHATHPWRDALTPTIARSKYLYDQGNASEALHVLQKQICKMRMRKHAFDPADLLSIYDENGFGNWRASLFELLSALPRSNVNLSQWVAGANAVLQGNPTFQGAELGVKRDSQGRRYGDLAFESVFGNPDPQKTHAGCYMGTVHSVKGRSLPAVMLVLKKRAGQSANYVNLLGTDITASEELRILYVALSRAAEILVLAVPDGDVPMWRERLGL